MDDLHRPDDRPAESPDQPVPTERQWTTGRLACSALGLTRAGGRLVRLDGGTPEGRVVVEGALPRDGTGRLLVPFRPGDVLAVSAPFVDTVATSVSETEAILRWPWRRADPDSISGWTGGEFGFPFREQHKTLYRTEPPLRALRAGQRCRVGIPPTLLHVVEIESLDAPEDTSMLPRPSGWLTLLPAGTAFDPTDRDRCVDVELVAAWEPDGPTPGVELVEPIRMELVFRPYAFLVDGEVVVDADGRRWRFEVPYWWQELGRAGQGWLTPRWVGAPSWPLALAAEDGAVALARGAAVAAATASGSHGDEVERWRELARAEPTPIRPFVDELADLDESVDGEEDR
jgi:hypothetical protein